MKIYVLILVFASFYSCNHSPTKAKEIKTDSENSDKTIQKKDTFDKSFGIDTAILVNPTFESTYKYEDDKILQILKVHTVNQKQIVFDLFSKNKKTKRTTHLNGIAQDEDNLGNSETDEDEEGNAYGASEYWYRSKCFLSIRMDIENVPCDQIQINEGNCLKDMPYHFTDGQPRVLRKMK